VFIFRSVCLFVLFLVVFSNPGKNQNFYTIHGFAQGTDYTVSYYATSMQVSKQQVDSVLLKIDSSMSLYKPYSLINKFNKSKTGILMDADLMTVIKKSFEISKESGGRFDITVAPLVQLWGFGPVPVSHYPDSLLIRETLNHIGMKQLKLIGKELLKKDPGVSIDLNGIAQGYSVDVLAAHLKHKGIQSFMVEIGGEVVVKGPKPDGTRYRIGIEGPGDRVFKHIVQINEGAVTTSGNYVKSMKYKEGQISHLINPKTGFPLNNQMISVTVYAKDALTADGYDNALMAMDIEDALTFVKRRKDLEAYFIYRKPNGQHADTLTNGFKKLLVN
jgi:thiamine biosynthesis lipoprotein